MKALQTKTYTVSNTAVGISVFDFGASHLSRARMAKICAAKIVRFTEEGTDPTTTLGNIVAADSVAEEVVGHANVSRLKLIRGSADDAVTSITLYA